MNRTMITRGIVALMLFAGIAGTVPFASMLAETSTPAASPEATPDAYGGTVVKEVLEDDSNSSASSGEILSLTRYTIPAGAKLPVHTHPGVQLASVVSGELTYHVLEGELFVTRGDGAEETHHAGDTVVFTVGDSWEEPKGMVHYAENLSDQPVVLISSALLDANQPATILVDLGTPAASPAA